MTGHGHGQPVGGACTGHGAYGPRGADAGGNGGVAECGTHGDLAQGLPDSFLEGGALQVQRKVQPDGGGFHEADDAGYHLLEVVIPADEMCLGEAVLQVLHQHGRVVVHEDGADAALALGHQDGAQGALRDGEADRHAVTAGPIVAGTHAQQPVCLFVEATVGVEAGIVDGIGHAPGFAQGMAQPVGPVGRGVGLGGEPGLCLEDPVEM